MAVACLAGLAGSASAATPGDGFDVQDYAVAITPDIGQKTVAGRETITLRATRDGVRQLAFTGNALTIAGATLDGVMVIPRQTDGVLGFDLPEPLVRGRSVRLSLSYRGRPARGFVGTPAMLYTSYFACDWMICAQDAFGDKATHSIAIRVPAGMTTLSIGRRVARRIEPDGSEVHRWKSGGRYSAYLHGFAVGRFTRVTASSGTTRLVYLSDVADAAELRRRFAATLAMVRFLSGRAGMPPPVATYGQLLVAGDEAQEAATYAVLGVAALPTTADDPTDDWAIVHELAHLWWGNAVTCATLRDFWLNEGITTFMTAAWKEHRYGRAAYDAELDGARRRLERARGLGFDKPLAWPGRYPTLGTRRAVQYGKGALFMDRLRTVLGERAFWSGLRRYTRDHAGGTVTSIDFQRAMERASGRDLRPVFATWVFGEGTGETAAR